MAPMEPPLDPPLTMFPRRYIDPLGSEDIGHLPSRLAVELCGSFPDPLHFLGNEVGM